MICQQPSNVTTVPFKVSTVVIKGITNVLGYFWYLRNSTLDISRAWKIVAPSVIQPIGLLARGIPYCVRRFKIVNLVFDSAFRKLSALSTCMENKTIVF